MIKIDLATFGQENRNDHIISRWKEADCSDKLTALARAAPALERTRRALRTLLSSVAPPRSLPSVIYNTNNSEQSRRTIKADNALVCHRVIVKTINKLIFGNVNTSKTFLGRGIGRRSAAEHSPKHEASAPLTAGAARERGRFGGRNHCDNQTRALPPSCAGGHVPFVMLSGRRGEVVGYRRVRACSLSPRRDKAIIIIWSPTHMDTRNRRGALVRRRPLERE
ncbi:hypothetical protein EVAR_89179_1 [Eumeta japonica]|uniref:Uncharacterized protein n=1 Tax=Eumeta variegata TaxID=151549 RepID=A0A4C1YFU2_EUMVA|nr:hypothetical protein EVAR_89179_1 [Eumeta japonica]